LSIEDTGHKDPLPQKKRGVPLAKWDKEGRRPLLAHTKIGLRFRPVSVPTDLIAVLPRVRFALTYAWHWTVMRREREFVSFWVEQALLRTLTQTRRSARSIRNIKGGSPWFVSALVEQEPPEVPSGFSDIQVRWVQI